MDGLTDILDDLRETEEGDKTSVGEILDHFSDRSLGAILTVIGLVAAIPVIGGIPGMSVIAGMLVVFAVVQSVFGGESGLWAPEKLRRQKIESRKIDEAVDAAKPYAEWVDSWLKHRAAFAISKPLISVSAAILGLIFIPMAIVPWGVMLPAFGVILLGLSLIGKDGVFAMIGYGLVILSAVVVYRYGL